MSASGLDEGLMRRLRDAGRAISWRPVRERGSGPGLRIARLRDEEATVELREGGSVVTTEVTAGPVGALVLLLEIDRRGPPARLGSRNAGRSARFPAGSIAAAWGGTELAADATPTLRDLVDLARYALV